MADRAYGDTVVVANAAPRERSVGEHIFIWVAWALAAAFWGLTMSSFVGILRDTAAPSPAPVAAGVLTGAIYFVVGVLVLAAAIAFGAIANARRNRRLDPVTEAATARLYELADREGGADLTTRSPGARTFSGRDTIQPDGGA